MHAVTLSSFGGPEVLRWSEVPDPGEPAAGEVLIDVVASAVNRADLLQRQGYYPPPPGASDILGLECSGRIAAVGPEVDAFAVGDEVCALLAGGGYASAAVVPVGQVMSVPGGIELITAGGLPEVACTVYDNLFRTAALADGETVLIHGGSSGIGTMAIQTVRALRPTATIAVTAGTPEKLARCTELGADIAINYREEDFVEKLRSATDGRGADVILDNMGAKYLSRNIDALAPDGRLVIIGMQGGAKAEINLGALLPKRATVAAKGLRGRPPAQKADVCAGVVRELWPAIADGRVRPVVDRVLPMSDPIEAHTVVESSTHIGKVLLAVP
jgi:NADPH2:quinone reductase